MTWGCKLIVKTLSCIDHQGKSFNTNIAKVQAQNLVFLPLDGIEFVLSMEITFMDNGGKYNSYYVNS